MSCVLLDGASLSEGLRARLRGMVTLAVAALPFACAGAGSVERVVDGRVMEGAFVAPEAYAAFLRGVVAEERGQRDEALRAFTEVTALDPDDPEVWTRIGHVRCVENPRDPAAERAFARAMEKDPEYGPAWAARAECALARGESEAAAGDAWRATQADPLAVEPEVLLAKAQAASDRAPLVRQRLVALTLVQGTRVSAWESLAGWARSHGDAELASRALSHVARLAPSERRVLGARAVEMAGEGQLSAARALAGAILDVPGDRSSGGLGPAAAASPLVARLALDDALVARDADRARERAVRAHVSLDIVAGRALEMGDAPLARALAEPVAEADPGAIGVRLVLAAAGAETKDDSLPARALAGLPGASEPIAPEVLLPFVRLLARVGGPALARKVAEQAPHGQLLAGDSLVTPLAVELAAGGVLAESALPADARIELAARELAPPPLGDLDAVDPRHRLLALALAEPRGRAALALAEHLAPAATRDPLVAVAFVRLSLARGAKGDHRTLDRLVQLNPADPIVAAAALDLAKLWGDERVIAPARARLTALAVTQGERAHALE